MGVGTTSVAVRTADSRLWIIGATRDVAVVVDAGDGEGVSALVKVGVGAAHIGRAQAEGAGDLLAVLFAAALVVGVETVLKRGGAGAEGEGRGTAVAGTAESGVTASKVLGGATYGGLARVGAKKRVRKEWGRVEGDCLVVGGDSE